MLVDGNNGAVEDIGGFVGDKCLVLSLVIFILALVVILVMKFGDIGRGGGDFGGVGENLGGVGDDCVDYFGDDGIGDIRYP